MNVYSPEFYEQIQPGQSGPDKVYTRVNVRGKIITNMHSDFYVFRGIVSVNFENK